MANSLLGQGSLSTYQSNFREKASDWLRGLLFSDDRAGQRKAERLLGVLETTSPVGVATGIDDMREAVGQGDYASAGLLGAMAMVPGPSPKIKAYHGSPHSFDRFSMDKIGTGEGAQAYGHGLYFAESEGVAQNYRDALSKGNLKINYGGADISSPSDMVAMTDNLKRRGASAQAKLLDEYQKFGGDLPSFIKDRKDWYRGNKDMEAAIAQFEQKTKAEWLPGSMYEVNINASPDDFLDWDKPLSEQPEKVRKMYAQAAAGDDPILSELLDGSPESLTYTGLFPRSSGAQAYNTFTQGNKEVATQRLREAGIPGIKYLDAGSRGKGDGSRNYVVFDDKLIEIVRKYGIAGASAMLGYNLLEGVSPAEAKQLQNIELASKPLLGGGGW